MTNDKKSRLSEGTEKDKAAGHSRVIHHRVPDLA